MVERGVEDAQKNQARVSLSLREPFAVCCLVYGGGKKKDSFE